MAMHVLVIGGGIGGLSSAALLARDGYSVTIIERNDQIGGRARRWTQDGFSFDMGLTWYLMPEVYERFFSLFGKKRETYYRLVPLDPYFQAFFRDGEPVLISRDLERVQQVFEQFEPYGGRGLHSYMQVLTERYEEVMAKFLYSDGLHLGQLFDLRFAGSLERTVCSLFRSDRAKQIIEHTPVFLGSDPKKVPVLYSILSHVDPKLGVFVPEQGMAAVVDSLARLCTELGVQILTRTEVSRILTKNGRAYGVVTNQGELNADVIVSTADYHHTDTDLLPPEGKTYSEFSWSHRKVASSMFVAYLGLGRRLRSFKQHNLFLPRDWTGHLHCLYESPCWPEGELCICLDLMSAPPGCEAVVLQVPLAAGLEDNLMRREQLFKQVIEQIKVMSGEDLSKDLVVKRLYTQQDFIDDYHAFKGTAFGLANTMVQSFFLRPSRYPGRISNLFLPDSTCIRG